MISLVCVSNNPSKLEARLKAGLARQSAPYQLIVVDNRDARFAAAAPALNTGAAQAEGEWIAFVHQDVELLGQHWLRQAENFLSNLDPGGWHGVVGRSAQGRWRGLLRDRDMVFGEPFETPIEVQTLDEVLLIHRNRGAGYRYFDEQIPGWHAYGVDACCQAIRAGARNFVLPLTIWHDSTSSNQAGLREAHAYVWSKHGGSFDWIYTTCGVLPHPYGWSGSYKLSSFFRRFRDFRHLSWIRKASAGEFQKTPWQVLEELTLDEPVVHCFHRRHPIDRLEGCSFLDRAQIARRVLHRFAGLPAEGAELGCVVIAPDLSTDARSLHAILTKSRRLIVALHLDGSPGPDHWRERIGRDYTCYLAMEPDETRWAILDVQPAACGDGFGSGL